MSEQWIRLRIREVPLQWHEAVAIVRDVADALAGGKISWVPSSEALAVDDTGLVHLLQQSATSGLARSSGPADVAQLSGLLSELLPSDGTPQELVRLGSNAVGPRPANAADFSRALAFFERPSRQEDLQRLAARLCDAQDQHRLDAELESLTRKARSETSKAPKPFETGSPHGSLAHIRFPVMLLVVGIVLLAMAVTFVGLRLMTPGVPLPDKPTPANHEEGFLARMSKAAHSLFAGPNVTAVPRKTGHAAAHEPERRKSTRKHARSTAISERQQTPRVVEWPQLPLWHVEESGAPLRSAISLPPAAKDVVYDSRNEDVIPAALVRPRLASVTDANALARARSVLDVVIDEDGRVTQVRLVRTTPERRYYDVMLLPAVKAWVFQPAIRGTSPVRYRLQIPLT